MEIKDYPNYLIYEDGRVFSKNKNKFLNPTLTKQNYYRIGLRTNNKSYSKLLHRLIAEHYIPNPNNLPEIDHINRITTDNTIKNLRWVDRYTNNQNIGVQKNNKLKIQYISVKKNIKEPTYRISITRYGLNYCKTKKTMEEAIVQRDLMLSMFQLIA